MISIPRQARFFAIPHENNGLANSGSSSSPRQAAVIIRIATVASDICVRILIGIMHRQVDAPYVLRFLPYQSWSLRIHACVFGTRARPIRGHELTHTAWRSTTHRRVHGYVRRVRVGASPLVWAEEEFERSGRNLARQRLITMLFRTKNKVTFLKNILFRYSICPRNIMRVKNCIKI